MRNMDKYNNNFATDANIYKWAQYSNCILFYCHVTKVIDAVPQNPFVIYRWPIQVSV